MQITIIQEHQADYQQVERLIQTTFAGAPHSDGNEHLLVGKLRRSAAFIKELSLVASVDAQIVGHILLTRIQIGSHLGLALAPLAVLPDYQGKGVGKALIEQAHNTAKALGFECVVVLGEPNYYQKFGYQPAKAFNITPPFDIPEAYYQVCFLGANTQIEGVVVYDPAFGV